MPDSFLQYISSLMRPHRLIFLSVLRKNQTFINQIVGRSILRDSKQDPEITIVKEKWFPIGHPKGTFFCELTFPQVNGIDCGYQMQVSVERNATTLAYQGVQNATNYGPPARMDAIYCERIALLSDCREAIDFRMVRSLTEAAADHLQPSGIPGLWK